MLSGVSSELNRILEMKHVETAAFKIPPGGEISAFK